MMKLSDWVTISFINTELKDKLLIHIYYTVSMIKLSDKRNHLVNFETYYYVFIAYVQIDEY